MANRDRRAAAANRIRGPQSALTDFLASHNISAQQISSDYQRRVREAEEAAEQAAAAEAQENKENESAEDDGEDPVERKKRKRKEEKAIMKIKQSKEFKKRKYEQKEEYGRDADDDDAIARSMLAKSKPLPGQLDNCDLCEKRFTVTPYSKTGPKGGLLCGKCSKEAKDLEKKDEAEKKKKQKVTRKGQKRQTESDRMMGDVQPGSKSLAELCVRRVADVVHDIEEFGDLPQNLLDRLSQILSKKRVVTPRTLNLFLRPEIDRIDVYDAAKLNEEDFNRIFAFMPNLAKINLRFAGQLKDESLLYMVEKCHKIMDLQLGATNLITDKVWTELFQQRGHQLRSLKLSELNDSLTDESVEQLVNHCTNLKRLKLRSCSHMNEASIVSLGRLHKLEHLTLAVAQHTTSAGVLADLIRQLGPNLQTLCLEGFEEADDSALAAIRSKCSRLSKLRITGSTLCTDRTFANLFDNNSGIPPLSHVDFSECRDIEDDRGEGAKSEEDRIGFASHAFEALMYHSGERIETLDLHACRHISHAALTNVFDGKNQYPLLKHIDLSFVRMVDDVVLAGIFKSCPALTKLVVFACFNARQARIPLGVAVIGLPNAQDSIVQEGDAMMEWA